MTGRLGSGRRSALPPIAGVRVVIDVRPIQDPAKAPTTATYLAELLSAYAADPLAGESFAILVQAGLPDPVEAAGLDDLPIVSRRAMPPTSLLGSGSLTVDPFLLRSASVGTAWGAEREGAVGSVYHTAGGAVPLGSSVPVVVTLLDLAPWELPNVYQASFAARFGQRLRARILRDAAAVIVGSTAAAVAARRLLHIRRDRIRIVALAPRAAFRPEAAADAAAEAALLGIPGRYFVYPGRYDARQDLGTLLRALATLAAGTDGTRDRASADGRPRVGARARAGSHEASADWPPRLVLVGASPDDRAALARAAAREGVGELLAYAPYASDERLAALVAGARAVVLPTLSDAAGLSAIEATAAGVPIIASAVGALPELAAGVGILVEPRDPARLAAALATAWSDDAVHDRLATAARARSQKAPRAWGDVARETRAVYASIARSGIRL
jgi:O-antigen biosynthesis alpha-1,3-rhamnosyltransferase